MFLHIDMDYFFAQIEEKRHPASGDMVIVVCMFSGRTKDSGVVSTVNYRGRRLGIHSGMPIMQARRLAPPAQSMFIPADREQYAIVSGYIDAVIRSFCARAVQASIDEWNAEEADDAALAKGKALKEAILKETGLTCSVGLAPSLLGAKMAASESKPDGFLAIDAGREKEIISGSVVEKVPGIGDKTAQALHALGVERVRDIERLDSVMLVETFGRKAGAWLIDLGKGEYGGALGEEKEQVEVSRIGTLKEKTRDSYLIIARLDELEGEAKEWLMQMKKSYRTLSLIFVTDDLKIHTRSQSFRNPKTWSEGISREKEALVTEFLSGSRLEVRRVGIRFGNFMDLSNQTTLF